MQQTESTPPSPGSSPDTQETPAHLLDNLDWLPAFAQPAIDLAKRFPFIATIVFVVSFYALCKVAEVAVARVLRRLTASTETEFDDKLIKLLHRPVFPTVFSFGLVAATRALGLRQSFEDTVTSLLLTLVLLYWLLALFPALRLILDSFSRHHERFSMIEERTLPLFSMLGKLVLIGAGSYAFLAIWGIDPRPWLASAGIVGIAIGFAAKDSLANLFGGVFVVADSPYKLGDFINLDSGERGRVTHIGIRSTRMLTRDDVEITIPNAQIANAKVINESGGPWEKERIRIKVGVAYGSDVDRVCDLLVEIAHSDEHICASPDPRVRMRGFGASSLDFELLCWIDEPVLRGKLSHEMYMKIYRAFGEEGIEIPYAKWDVHIKEMPEP